VRGRPGHSSPPDVSSSKNAREPVVAADGATAELSVVTPDAPTAVVVVVPAMGVPAAYYEPLARALVDRDVAVATAELRGIGSSSIRARRDVDFGWRELIELDMPAYLDAVRRRFGDLPRVLLGHSLGGQLAALHLARDPEAARSLVLVASGSVWFRNFGAVRGAALLGVSRIYRATTNALGYFPGRRLGFGGTEARGVMLDWAHHVRTGRYRLRGAAFDYDAALAEVRVPVLGLSIAGDTWAPPACTAHLFGKMSAAETSARVLAPAPGETLDHFRWVRRPAVVVDAVAPWVGAVLSAG
jgi:predicted alpha/beta hydrolase